MFNIKIYLDDNLDGEYLSNFLEKKGFEVISPRKIGMHDKKDEEHLKCAVINNATVLTSDKNFPTASNSKNINHKGILIRYRTNNPKKSMNMEQIAIALKNIEERSIDLENKIYPLNIFK